MFSFLGCCSSPRTEEDTFTENRRRDGKAYGEWARKQNNAKLGEVFETYAARKQRETAEANALWKNEKKPTTNLSKFIAKQNGNRSSEAEEKAKKELEEFQDPEQYDIDCGEYSTNKNPQNKVMTEIGMPVEVVQYTPQNKFGMKEASFPDLSPKQEEEES